MIFTQIAAFVVLVAVPVGAALYCGYAFFKKRHQMAWTRKDFCVFGAVAALVLIYAVCLGRQYLFNVMFSCLMAALVYILMRVITLRQTVKAVRSIIIAFLCVSGLVYVFISFLFFVKSFSEVCFFSVFVVLPLGLSYWLEHRKMISEKQPSAYFAGLGYMMLLAAYMTVQFTYYPIFLKEYKCIPYNGGDITITTGHPVTSTAPNVFQKIFRNNERWVDGMCFCPEGRTGLTSYEESKLCLSESEARKNWEDKTEENRD